MFNQQELQVIATLLNRVQITGQEAMAVAVLQQKITSLLAPVTEPQAETKTDKK